MRAAQIENGIVVAVIVIGDPAGLSWAVANLGGEWVDGVGAEIGYLYRDGSFIHPPPPEEELEHA
jgi:hypothetical protein